MTEVCDAAVAGVRVWQGAVCWNGAGQPQKCFLSCGSIDINCHYTHHFAVVSITDDRTLDKIQVHIKNTISNTLTYFENNWSTTNMYFFWVWMTVDGHRSQHFLIWKLVSLRQLNHTVQNERSSMSFTAHHSSLLLQRGLHNKLSLKCFLIQVTSPPVMLCRIKNSSHSDYRIAIIETCMLVWYYYCCLC